MAENKTILIIEDSQTLADMLKGYIEKNRLNTSVITANDGEAGLKMINENNPDLIILDIILPKIGGIELFKMLLKDGKPRIPVLVFTSRDELEEFFYNAGAEGFLPKTTPFDLKFMLSEIDRILARRDKPIIFLIDSENKKETVDLKLALIKKGFKIIFVNNLDAFKVSCSKYRPDIILMNYEQESMPGDEFIKKIVDIRAILQNKAWPQGHKALFLVYNYSNSDYRDICQKLGADDYLGTPSSAQELAVKLREYRDSQEREKIDKEVRKSLDRELGPKDKPGMGDLGSLKF